MWLDGEGCTGGRLDAVVLGVPAGVPDGVSDGLPDDVLLGLLLGDADGVHLGHGLPGLGVHDPCGLGRYTHRHLGQSSPGFCTHRYVSPFRATPVAPTWSHGACGVTYLLPACAKPGSSSTAPATMAAAPSMVLRFNRNLPR